jgi:hypothetical protein
MRNSLGLALKRVQERYARRFPNSPSHRFDTTSIVSRWYWRGTASICRDRFGKWS